jgi:hypothetical protein
MTTFSPAQMLSRSVWINGQEGRYKIYDDGRVQSFCRGKIFFKKQTIGKGGYPLVTLGVNGKSKIYETHSIVAKHFVPGYKPGLTVNHKDLNKRNNHFSNLEWITQEDNAKHAWKHGKCINTVKSSEKKIVATNVTTGEERLFDSAVDASKEGFSVHSISKCAHKKMGKHRGFYWRFAT